MKSINGMNVPETEAEKLKVLKEARKKLEQGFTQSKWCEIIDGVHHYCLYGALVSAMGLDFDKIVLEYGHSDPAYALEEVDQNYIFSQYDKYVSKCSLTSTLFEVAQPENIYSNAVRAWDEHGVNGVKTLLEKPYGTDVPWHGTDEQIIKAIEDGAYMSWKVSALQYMNDDIGREAVLDAIDKAIEQIESQHA